MMTMIAKVDFGHDAALGEHLLDAKRVFLNVFGLVRPWSEILYC